MSRRKKREKQIQEISRELSKKGNLDDTKNYLHHKHTSVYDHVHRVARISCWLNDHLRLNADAKKLIRSSLLHDYFLYDWHDKEHDHPRPHGFYHPRVAMNQAHEHFDLDEREKDAILRHMFPLTIIPPKHREGWIVTAADKLAAIREMLKKKKAGK